MAIDTLSAGLLIHAPRAGVRPSQALSHDRVIVFEADGRRTMTSAKATAPAARPAVPPYLLPRSYIDPRWGYDLVQEPDQRWRIVAKRAERPGMLLAFPEAKLTDGDNRVRITNTTVWPWTVQGHMIMTFPDGSQYIGSGTMLYRHHVLTAGHCVYSASNGGWASSVQFNAAQNDGTLPFGSAWATLLASFNGWVSSGLRDWDMGILVLNEDLGNSTGWMGIISTSDGNLMNHQITVAGYPGDKGGQQLWASTNPIVGVLAQLVSYNAYTKGGDSGAAAYGLWQGVDLEHQAADHVAGPDGIPNTGCRVSADKFQPIVDFINSH